MVSLEFRRPCQRDRSRWPTSRRGPAGSSGPISALPPLGPCWAFPPQSPQRTLGLFSLVEQWVLNAPANWATQSVQTALRQKPLNYWTEHCVLPRTGQSFSVVQYECVPSKILIRDSFLLMDLATKHIDAYSHVLGFALILYPKHPLREKREGCSLAPRNSKGLNFLFLNKYVLCNCLGYAKYLSWEDRKRKKPCNIFQINNDNNRKVKTWEKAEKNLSWIQLSQLAAMKSKSYNIK